MVIHTLSESEEFVFASGRVVIALERRRRAAEDDRAFLDLRADNGDVARVITRSFFLFVSRLVFFVDNDESEVLQRREDRASRADHNSRAAGMDLVPLVMTLALR